MYTTVVIYLVENYWIKFPVWYLYGKSLLMCGVSNDVCVCNTFKWKEFNTLLQTISWPYFSVTYFHAYKKYITSFCYIIICNELQFNLHKHYLISTKLVN